MRLDQIFGYFAIRYLLVLWRPGITAWIIIWGNDNNESIEIRLNSLKSRRSPQTFAEKESKKDGVSFYTYRLNESSEDNIVPALYCFAFSNEGHVQMAIYFDKEADSVTAEKLFNSIDYAR